jgi:hypothetical protein
MVNGPREVHHHRVEPLENVVEIHSTSPSASGALARAPGAPGPSTEAAAQPSASAETVDEAREVPSDRERLVTLARAVVGLAGLAADAAIVALDRASGRPHSSEEAATTSGPSLVIGAGLGLSISIADRATRVADGVMRVVVPPAGFIAGTFFADQIRGARERLTGLDATWRARRPEAELVGGALASEIVRGVALAVADQLDLMEVIRRRVDLDALVADVDMEAIVERIDVEAIVAGIDLDALAARLDVDAVASRLDVQAVIERIDLVALARYVIDEIDLPEVIRGSTGAMASETVRGVRMQGIEADRAVERIVDRLLRRDGSRDTDPIP